LYLLAAAAGVKKGAPATTDRIKTWLSRELSLLIGETNREFVLNFIVDLILRFEFFSSRGLRAKLCRDGLDDQAAVIEQLQCFFFERTELFVHEMTSFARSRLDMAAYDKHARYPSRLEEAIFRRVSNTFISKLTFARGSEHISNMARFHTCLKLKRFPIRKVGFYFTPCRFSPPTTSFSRGLLTPALDSHRREALSTLAREQLLLRHRRSPIRRRLGPPAPAPAPAPKPAPAAPAIVNDLEVIEVPSSRRRSYEDGEKTRDAKRHHQSRRRVHSEDQSEDSSSGSSDGGDSDEGSGDRGPPESREGSGEKDDDSCDEELPGGAAVWAAMDLDARIAAVRDALSHERSLLLRLLTVAERRTGKKRAEAAEAAAAAAAVASTAAGEGSRAVAKE
jgi:hypothetical protein